MVHDSIGRFATVSSRIVSCWSMLYIAKKSSVAVMKHKIMEHKSQYRHACFSIRCRYMAHRFRHVQGFLQTMRWLASLSFRWICTMMLCRSLKGPLCWPGPRLADERVAQTSKIQSARELKRARAERQLDLPTARLATFRSSVCLRNVMLRQKTEAKAGLGRVSARALVVAVECMVACGRFCLPSSH